MFGLFSVTERRWEEEEEEEEEELNVGSVLGHHPRAARRMGLGV